VYGGDRHGIEFRLLGSVEVAAGNRVIEIGSLKQRVLLVALLLRLNHPVSADTLVEDLWGDTPPRSVAQSLQSLASRLKRALETGDDALVGSTAPRLRGRDGGYVLEADPESVDAVRFERFLAAGRDALATNHVEAAVQPLEAGLALWRGSALGELSDRPFAQLEASRLEEARMTAVEELAEAYLALGRGEDALTRLTSHVGRHPLRERAWGQLMLALYRLGRQADALRAYQRVRHILAEELGVDPTPELRLLEERILRQSPDLEGPQIPPAPSPPRWSADIVVFLFTDIEASTRRWEGDQEAMAGDLALHDGLLLDAVEGSGGDVFSHTGDGFCIAFPTVPHALEAAVTAQRALVDATWSSPVPLRVRMAVHAGAAEHRAGNWFGPTLNRASRLLATAAGGQVVCSQVTVDLSQDELPAGVGLIDLGEHRLADLSRPERVYQLTHRDLPGEFPPLQSLDTRRHNLPVALTSFVGREQELDEVLALLQGSRLLTLAGTGGAGKTRLALQVAAAFLGRLPDGAWFVELASLRDPDQVTAEAVTTLGFLPGGLASRGESLEERLCDHLRARRLLLVLDNCEHVVEAAARLAHTVLARCPDVTVLATSREVLGLAGEVVWKVPPLSLPPAEVADPEALAGCDAVALFCERARAAQPGFGLSAANAAAVAGICRRLDGIPLGLELAAAKIRVLGAHQVAERLDDRFRLLAGGTRMAVPRHQTLRAAMDWSFELLPAPEQVVLRRLAVFPGTFTLAAVEAVVGTVPQDSVTGPTCDIVELLGRLVDKSLITVWSNDPEVRYGLLETVREYAGQKLAEAGELEATRARQRDYCLGLVDRWIEESAYHRWDPWIRRLIADGGFATAMEWSLVQGDNDELLRLAAAHWPYWYWTETPGWRRWLEAALARCDTPSRDRVEALIGQATLLRDHPGESGRCDALLDEALETAQLLESDHLVAQAGFYRSDLMLARGDRPGAESLVRQSLALWEKEGFGSGRGWCHGELGWIALAEGHVDLAADQFEAALQIGEQIADDTIVAHVRPALALVAALRGDHQTAQRIADAGIQAALGIEGAPRVQMMALARAGQVAVLGSDPMAISVLSRLLSLLRETGARYWVDEALELTGLALADQLPDRAATVLASGEILREELADAGGRQDALVERLRDCRARLRETLGLTGWDESQRRGRPMSALEAIDYALASLDAIARLGD
jgi:predicted ATPase/DNA-binding SARP family transcriptional activator